MAVRAQQRDATRTRIIDAAVAALVEHGYAATSTVDVQRRAGVSRGALLHHFPTRAALFAATIDVLVERNQAAVEHGLDAGPHGGDRVERAIRALGYAVVQPALQAELELWAIARIDPDLRAALTGAERRARADLERVIDTAFAGLEERPGYRLAVSLTVEFLRGYALSSVLRGGASPARLDDWTRAVRVLLDHPSRSVPS